VADVRQRGQRLTFRMQSLATLAREETEGRPAPSRRWSGVPGLAENAGG